MLAEKLTELKIGTKFRDSGKTIYYVSAYRYDRPILDINKKINRIEISAVLDDRYITDWDYNKAIHNLNTGSWHLA